MRAEDGLEVGETGAGNAHAGAETTLAAARETHEHMGEAVPKQLAPRLQLVSGRAFWLISAIVFVYAGLLLFAHLGALPLIDPDEGRNAQVAREVLQSGSWLVPTYNGHAYLDKPIFHFEAVALAYRIFGVGEAAARLPAALCGLALIALLFLFCLRAYGRVEAIASALVLASAPLFLILSRAVIFDVPLTLAITLSIVCVFEAERREGSARRGMHALGAFFAGIGVLIKGPVGLLVPGIVLLADHVLATAGRGTGSHPPASNPPASHLPASHRQGFLGRFFSPLNFLALFAPVLLWFGSLVRACPDMLPYGLIEETFRRYSTTAFKRSAPFFYYGPVLLIAFFPWSALLPEATARAWKRRRRWTEGDHLLVVWAVAVIVFFSTSRSKLPAYILPAVIALAALVARLFGHAVRHREGEAARIFSRGVVILACVSVLLAAFCLLTGFFPQVMEPTFHLNGQDYRRLCPLFLPVGFALGGVGAACAIVRRWRRSAGALALFALVPALLAVVSWGGVAEFSLQASSRRLSDAMPALPSDARVACMEGYAPGLPFYLRRPVALVSKDGHEFTSNYFSYRLRNGDRMSDILIDPSQFDSFVDNRDGPLYLLARKQRRAALEKLAARAGVGCCPLARNWWGAFLPAREGRTESVPAH
ncbi:MAG: glycosyltransferase family 39 protein [Candidatus Eisenbacteria bacterium]|nr:glycosyltransferase family 39 protein [Candidatus Eisenbacteria bacterium]